MRRTVMAGLMAAARGGCAQQGATQGATTQPIDGGATALATFGTPFLIVAKIPVCIATVAMAAPVGALSELSDPETPFGHELRQDLSDGIAQNCGPPYMVSP